MEQSGVSGQAVDAYRKALASAASAAAYAVMARSMGRELFPPEFRAAALWASSALLERLGRAKKERRTLVVRSQQGSGGGGGREENLLFDAARTYLASKLDPRAMPRLGLTLARARDADGRKSWRRVLFLEPGESTDDVFDGVPFKWACVEAPSGSREKKKATRGEPGTGGDRDFVLELSFAAEHTDVAVDQYVSFVMKTAEEVEQRDRALKICMNEGRMWYRVSHHHPATFDSSSERKASPWRRQTWIVRWRLKEKLTCGVHTSASGGREKQRGYFGTYESTLAFSHLHVGPTLSNT